MLDTAQATDLDQMLFAQRRLMVSGPLETTEVNRIGALLMTLDGVSADPIDIMVNSPGGPVADALGLIDIMGLVRGPVNTMATRAEGTALVVVALASGSRESSQHGTFSLRMPTPTLPGTAASQLGQAAALHNNQLEILAQLLAGRTGWPVAAFADEFRRGPIHTPEAALELGLIDHVRSPK